MRTDDLTFLATTYAPTCRIRLDKHLHGYATLQFMAQGGIELAYDDDWAVLEGAWFWTAYPGPRLRFRHVGFQGPMVQRWIAENLWFTRAQPAPPGMDWERRFDLLIALSQRHDHWGKLRAIHLLEQILIELAEVRAESPRQTNPWLETTLRLLTENESFVPDYSAIARASGMALSTLRRRFREETGVSLHTYVLQRRTGQARTLLTETELSLAQIAERLGYENLYYFARQFKEQVGIPPGQYRRTRQV
jgi:AraC-like DNA-binding protein